MKRLAALLLLLAASQAFAAAPEICGDGIDDSLMTGGAAAGTWGSCPANYHNAIAGTGAQSTWGCDADCDSPDKDNDGFNSDGSVGWAGLAQTDCDDTRSDVYPGVYVPNSFTLGSATGYKLCQTNGSYGLTTLTSVTPLDEHVGTGVARYVDCGNSTGLASDANSGLTYLLPKLTRAGVISAVNPDDFVYFIGTGTCTEASAITRGGTSGHPITWKNYPGASAKQDSTTTTFDFSAAADWQELDNLDLNGTTGMMHSFADHVRVDRSSMHDLFGNGSNNNSCLYWNTTVSGTVYRSFFRDCLNDGVAGHNVENAASALWLDDTGGGVGADHAAFGNTIWYTTYAAANNGPAIKYKHGVTLAESGANGWQVKYNTALNYGNDSAGAAAIMTSSSGLRAQYNRFWSQPSQTVLRVFCEVGPRNEDNRFQYNTLIAGDGIGWTPCFSGSEKLTVDHNILVDTIASYGSDILGILSICGRCTAGQKTTFESGSDLASDQNCFYSPNATAQFSYFHDSGVGSNYSFANWKGTVGQDIQSLLQNPNISAPKFQASAGCSAYGASVSTSTTTTVVTTTTLTATLPSIFPQN